MFYRCIFYVSKFGYNSSEVIPLKFNPKDKQFVNKTIRLDEELVKRVFEEAGKRGLSFNKFVAQCIVYAMDNLDSNIDDD